MTQVRKLLRDLASNLSWTWNEEVGRVFRDIEPELWERVNGNPTAFLADIDERKIGACAADANARQRLERTWQASCDYMHEERHWASRHAPGLGSRSAAYFSPEFGLHESLPVYSGGLGVLAGDHLKSSSDLGVPTWGVTLLYREGYFEQRIDGDGHQQERYQSIDPNRVGLHPVVDDQGAQRIVKLQVATQSIPIRIWRAHVGRATLLLLDASTADIPSYRDCPTQRLYAGDVRTRLIQELILGAGGWRALRLWGLWPGVLHLNEGHSAFAILEALAEIIETEHLSFDDALRKVRAHTVFTTHTPVEAGHDRFAPGAVLEQLDPLRKRLGISADALLALGRVHPEDHREPFCMTVLALKTASRSVGVSRLHGETSRAMWCALESENATLGAAIGHVTNGVHVPSWTGFEMAEFFKRRLGEDWASRVCQADLWERIRSVDPSELWDVKRRMKRRMLGFVDRRVRGRCERLGLPIPSALDADALTIGFARRMAEYKRSTLILRSLDRLVRLLTHEQRSVQIIFAGKAHPNDQSGKAILGQLDEMMRDRRVGGRLVLLEAYDMNVARHLVQGCDVWLNTPRRPLEACGTSGMKAIFNATLNCSTLDGWWAEAFDGNNGFAFGNGMVHADPSIQDAHDAKDLYQVLETSIVPDFYDRENGLPIRWLARVAHALVTLGPRYNSDRMVMDYVRDCYPKRENSFMATV